MKGVIILPRYLVNEWSPKFINGKEDFSAISSVTRPLWYALRDRLGFELRYEDAVSVSPDTDVVVMFGVPYHNRPNLIPGLLDLNKKIKLVMYPGDIQSYNNHTFTENRLKVFERSDLIVSGSYEYFSKLYPQFLHKYKFLPLFFGPHERYVGLPFNKNPKMRCLLSGSLNPQVYPLRSKIIASRHVGVDYRPATYAAGDAYSKLLNSYFCCVTSPSIFNYAVAKYFEILASGSLLIAPEIKDFNLAGCVANKHYVAITKDNALGVISHCLNSPEKYENIRYSGMQYVRANHSVNNTVNTMGTLLKELLNK